MISVQQLAAAIVWLVVPPHPHDRACVRVGSISWSQAALQSLGRREGGREGGLSHQHTHIQWVGLFIHETHTETVGGLMGPPSTKRLQTRRAKGTCMIIID